MLSLFWLPWLGSLELDQSIEQRDLVTCALIGTSRKLAAYNYYTIERRLSTSWWMHGVSVCQGIQKVTVGPATRSAVATCTCRGKLLRNVYKK